MAKKKKEEWGAEVIGLPSAILLPARRYRFKSATGHHVIEIPKSGNYKDIDPEFFSDKDGAFDFGKDETVFIPAINRVLFACKKYPELKANQAFALLAIKVKEDTVEIIGNLVEFLEAGDDNGMSEVPE